MAAPPRFPTLRETELGIPDGPIDGAALRDVFKRFFSQTNAGLDSTNRSLSRGLTPPDNFRCDIITAKATHGVPFTVRLKTIKQANSCLVVGFDTALPVGAGVQMLQPSQSGGFPTAQVTVWFNDITATSNVRLWLFEDGLQMTAVPTFGAQSRARAHLTVALSLPSGASTIINYDTIDEDSEGAITTGAAWKYTCKRAGLYSVTATAGIINALGAATFVLMSIAVNGSEKLRGQRQAGPAIGNSGTYLATGSVRLAVGDFVQILFGHNSGSTESTEAAGVVNHFETARVSS